MFCIELRFTEPPVEVVCQIFPWIEQAESDYKKRFSKLGRIGVDQALVYFLDALKWFRVVLAQDVAILASKYPTMGILKFSPFSDESFKQFAETAAPLVAKAELDARRALKELPDEFAESIQAILKTNHIVQEQSYAELKRSNEALQNDVSRLQHSLLDLESNSSRLRLKRKVPVDFEVCEYPLANESHIDSTNIHLSIA